MDSGMDTNWFVLFVKTGHELKVLREIDRLWDIGGLESFVPMYDARFRRHREILNERRRLFPGYVFIKTEYAEREFASRTGRLISRSEHALKLLRNGFDLDYSYVMKMAEIKTLDRLLNKKYCVEMSEGFIEGDKVVVTEGSLIGLESIIKYIDRHKFIAVIEIEIMGDKRPISVGLDIVSKV